MFGVFCQLISMFSFSLSNALWRKPIGKYHFTDAIFFRSIFSFLFFLTIVLVRNQTIDFRQHAFGCNILLYTFLVCLISYFGLFFFIKAIQKSSTGVVVTTTATTFLFGQLTAFFILKEALNNKIIISIILFSLAIFLTDYKDIKQIRCSKGVVYALIAAIIWGTTFPLLSVSSKQIGYDITGLILEFSVLLISSISYMLIKHNKQSFQTVFKESYIFIVLGVLAGIGVLFQNITYTKIPVYIAGAISSSSHILTIVFAYIIFKEKLTRMQIAASLVSTIAILFIIINL